MAADQHAEGDSRVWPSCTDVQVRVMLLGTYHMDNPGLDEVNVDADDVLAESRQTELRELAARLCEWSPDRVAVERPYDRHAEVNARYEEYRDGDRAYDREEQFQSPHPMRTNTTSECRSEVVQIGFRVADRCDHEYVAPIDEHPAPDRYDPDPFEDRDTDSTRKTAVTPADAESAKQELQERLVSSSIPAYLAWKNQERQLAFNHEGMFDEGIRATGDRFGTPLTLSHWYDRNIRMVHHVWRTMAAENDRVLLVVGSGHVRALRHLFTEAPMFCPVSPLPHLPAPE